ncbi:ABC transporter ATP-binding protein [Tuwongella immobilis]|uniref:ABC transporter domain-containing protein n=1 Tax=Tuwongella immobilis TaxID=692036 RepID=A0A6C2YTJ9_9BACT|nr:ABC transporter ATP-binding protein [Tuwongella immobilis]VIP04711.1 spermidine putrescine abc transporter atp-binding protein : Fe(3+) ions import ATP-binding protein FbpC OS=Rubellimicrobium mesophilum DSM 19309 GN=fbpC PE=3 SV=1: ABC_tran: TOBE_2 [Tuwongella immobilis]VTS06781.1 spermidine putrescine abc transporter atp-binding protein : Fe(3+) ions import ATP-binding protein FbpC OS=Rubellimicrobium mesophilum DSM 19309 GN=fbpC PE=3 SV=1: ABC_tran: TOBE_2 [Tuwongella immobilis]
MNAAENSAGRGAGAAVDLRIEQLSFGYAADHLIVADLTLEIPAGEFLTLVGPSGCGKSTLLRLIAGHLSATRGRLWLGGRDITRTPPEQRGIGLVFQQHALFPHLTAAQNIAFGWSIRGRSRRECQRIAAEWGDRVGLSTDQLARYPADLSGGQQQRVALARALALQPGICLLDEPFAQLDRPLREQLREELARLHHLTGCTFILVTHDSEDALRLADRVVVLLAGRMAQLGTPIDIYQRPRNHTIATLFGRVNRISSCEMVRPEQVTLVPLGEMTAPTVGQWVGVVERVRLLGGVRMLEIRIDSGDCWTVQQPADASWPIVGERVGVRPRPEAIHRLEV